MMTMLAVTSVCVDQRSTTERDGMDERSTNENLTTMNTYQCQSTHADGLTQRVTE